MLEMERHIQSQAKPPKEDDIDHFIKTYSNQNEKLFGDFKGKLPEKVIAKTKEQSEYMESFKTEVLSMGMNAFNLA